MTTTTQQMVVRAARARVAMLIAHASAEHARRFGRQMLMRTAN